jgi:hypothetical protein
MNHSQVKIEFYAFLERLLGKKVLRKLYINRCVKRYVKAKCIFIHIPKSGGTSVAHALIGERAGHFTAMEIRSYLGSKVFNSYFSFTITRHPYDRLFSAFNYVKNRGGTHGGVRWDNSFNDIPFENFNSFVSDWLCHQDLLNVNILFKPQYLFVCDQEGKLIVNYVCNLENLEPLKKEISVRLGKTVNFGFKNVTNSDSLKTEIPTNIKGIIYELYKKDFELFKYER